MKTQRDSNRLDLVRLFKILSNQKRLDILMTILDKCRSASEVAQIVGLDVSTTYRYLTSMKRAGILKSYRNKSIEVFDFNGDEVYKILELAIQLMSRLENRSFRDMEYSRFSESFAVTDVSSIKPDVVLDMRGEMCPVPDMTTQKKLSQMQDGQVLLVIVDYPLSAERIPNSVSSLGHTVLAKVKNNFGETSIYIQVKKGVVQTPPLSQ